jgi:hypothetical protein
MAILAYPSPDDLLSPATDPAGDVVVDLTEIAVAPALIVFVDVDALHPVGRDIVRVLDALGHARAHLVLYSRESSADVDRLRVELPRASWLSRRSAVGPGDILTLLKRGFEDARILAIGVRPDLRRALDASDAILSVDDTGSAVVADETDGYHRILLCSTLWALVRLRYRIRETVAE